MAEHGVDNGVQCMTQVYREGVCERRIRRGLHRIHGDI